MSAVTAPAGRGRGRSRAGATPWQFMRDTALLTARSLRALPRVP